MTNNNQNWQERLKEKWLASSGITTIDFILQEIGQEKEASRREAIQECVKELANRQIVFLDKKGGIISPGKALQELLNNNQSK